MALDFLPFKEGQKLTPAILNELVQAIMDGSIFAPGADNVVGDQVNGLAARVATLEAQVAMLLAVQPKNRKIQQITLTAGQQVINLDNPPTIDGEIVALNGQVLYKNDLNPPVAHDYTVSGSVLTLDIAVSSEVEAGDLLMVAYDYLVEA